jgi:hypothetical protein
MNDRFSTARREKFVLGQILQRGNPSKFRVRMFPSIDITWKIIDYIGSHVQRIDIRQV